MSSGFTDGSSARKLPVPSPGRRPQPKRPKPPPTAYTRAVGPTIDLPPGHGAQVFPLTSKSGFIGESFSMDSLEFMRWAAVRYDDDRFVLVVLVTLMGSQQPGGLIETTHDDVAQHLGYSFYPTSPGPSRSWKTTESCAANAGACTSSTRPPPCAEACASPRTRGAARWGNLRRWNSSTSCARSWRTRQHPRPSRQWPSPGCSWKRARGPERKGRRHDVRCRGMGSSPLGALG